MPEPRVLTLKSTLNELLLEAIENKAPKGVIRFNAGFGREIAFIVCISDAPGYLNALQAYEEGRDQFTMQAVNKVLDHVRKNGVPEENSDLNLVMHS